MALHVLESEADMKEKITLEREMQTLLIPLYGRAKMSEMGFLKDDYAAQTIDMIDYDFDKLRIPKKLQIFMSIRSSIIEDYTEKFIEENPNAMIISLGSGLDARYKRLGGYKLWVDLDFPQVIELRERLLPSTQNHMSIASSVTDWEWMDKLEPSASKTLVIAEGLLMYLKREQVRELFIRISEKLPNSAFIFDAYSSATVEKIKWQASMKKTGAVIHWGVDGPDDIIVLYPKMKHEKTIYLTDEKYINGLSPFYKAIFKFAGRFPRAREAHRLFVIVNSPLV